MADEAVRKEFEAWANSQIWVEGDPPETSRDDIGRYKYSDVQYGWESWQAARSLYRSAAIQECADKADELEKEWVGAGPTISSALLALKER